MSLLVYCLVYPVIWGISRLPFSVIYLLSDLLYFWLYRVFGYRKKVVVENLALAFPEKSDAERKAIEVEFYRHLCDVFLEMAKSLGMSTREMEKRFFVEDLGPLEQMDKDGVSVILNGGHLASWEWGMALNRRVHNLKAFGIYKPLANPYFDRLAKRIRGKWGTRLISTSETKEIVGENIKNNIPSIYGMLSDQSPMAIKADYWRSFMGVSVPVHTGAEKLARRWDLPMLFMRVEKVKRGHYKCRIEMLQEGSRDTERFEITNTYLDRVEEAIAAQPQYYLWTHKRFKHRNKDPKDYNAFVREES